MSSLIALYASGITEQDKAHSPSSERILVFQGMVGREDGGVGSQRTGEQREH